jgi:hypothetical protein
VTPDPGLLAEPVLVLLSWGAGIAGAGALVSWWRVVGAGFAWLAAGSAALVTFWGVLSPARASAAAALVALAVAAMLARRHPRATALAFATAALAAVFGAAGYGGWVLAVTGALALGGVTGEMLLGHWFLVDPSLPRWALKRLDGAGTLGLVLDAAAVALLAPVAMFGGLALTNLVYLGLVASSIVLMVLVWFALDQPTYSGVMAATGLSYLAVLTSLAAVFLGRAIGSGLVLFEGL